MQWLSRLRGCGLVAAMACGLIAGAPADARAQMLPPVGSIDVTPFLGFAFGSDQGGATLALGAAVAYNYTEQIALEGEIGILPDLEGDTDALDVGVATFSANVLYHFDAAPTLVPYATAGLGFGRTSFDFAEGPLDRSSTELAVNIGGGVKAEVGDRVIVRGDLRYFNVNDENPNFWRLYGGIVFRLRR